MTKRSIAVVLALIGFCCELPARVVRVEVLSKTNVLEGKAFGDAGAYEKIIGKIHFAVKPDDPHNKVAVDLDKAERNAAGEVEFASDFYLLRPKDAARSNGSVAR